MKFTETKSEDRKSGKKTRAARRKIHTECGRIIGSVYWQRMNERYCVNANRKEYGNARANHSP